MKINNVLIDLDNSAEKTIKQYITVLKEKGYTASGIKKMQYNFETEVRKSSEKLKLLVYFGKKGVKPVLQGNRNSAIYSDVSRLLFGEELFEIKKDEVPEPAEYIGTDESGKGDYFGPLVIAGVLVNAEVSRRLKLLGVKDSKELTDTAINKLAPVIKNTVEGRFNLVVITPEKYNVLQNSMGNVNRLLGWAHARVLENILKEYEAGEAVSDKFGDESLIKNSLQEKGKKIVLHQYTKAERYTAVAAASILARERFNRWFDEQESLLKIKLPKGASRQVEEAAEKVIKKLGAEKLKELAKIHFKTTGKINFI